MSKYLSGHTVGAVYDRNSCTPYLDAMPDMLSPEQFARVIASYPPSLMIWLRCRRRNAGGYCHRSP